MAIMKTDSSNYSAIADAIRAKGVEGSWKPAEMASAIADIKGGSEVSLVPTEWEGTPAYYRFVATGSKTSEFYVNILEDLPEGIYLYINVTGHSSASASYYIYHADGTPYEEYNPENIGPYYNATTDTIPNLKKGDRLLFCPVEPYGGYTISYTISFIFKKDGSNFYYDNLTWKPTVDLKSGTNPTVKITTMAEADKKLVSQGYLQIDDIKYMDAEGEQF